MCTTATVHPSAAVTEIATPRVARNGAAEATTVVRSTDVGALTGSLGCGPCPRAV